MHAVVPYDRGDLVAAIHETGMLLSVEHQEDGTAVHARVSERLAADLAPFAALSRPGRCATQRAMNRASTVAAMTISSGS